MSRSTDDKTRPSKSPLRAAHHRNVRLLSGVHQDIQLTFRTMRRAPVISGIMILSLAVGVGLNGAAFAALDGLLFRPPAGVHYPRLVRRISIAAQDERGAWNLGEAVGSDDISAFRAALTGAAHVEGYRLQIDRTADGSSVGLSVTTGGYFDLLGVRPLAGRFYNERDDSLAAVAQVAVLSAAYWRSHYGADPAIVGHPVVIDSLEFRVLGIAADGFQGVDASATDVWVPLGTLAALNRARGAVPAAPDSGQSRQLIYHVPQLSPLVRVSSDDAWPHVAALLTAA
ncbi:MAG: ABC transporter permease, partial [Gemmatimonadales bacterium]